MNSSVPEKKGFASFLATSFELLEREMPALYARMCELLAPRRVVLNVDRESVALAFSRRQARFVEIPETAEVHVATTSRAVLRVIDAQNDLMAAVLADELHVRGELDDLVAFHDGLLAYVHGAVRAPSFPQLLREYRAFERKERNVAA